MCDVIDHYIHVGEEKGIAIGLVKGETIGFEKGRNEGETIGFEKGEATTIWALADSGMNPEEIASRLKKDLGYIMKVIQKRPLRSMN